MPDYVNTNRHGVTVQDPDAKRTDGVTRVGPGQFSAEGDFEKAVKDVPGVVEAESQEGREWVALHPPESEESQGGSLTDTVASTLGEARSAARRFLAATNQVIVGDDEAPYGPDTGTITTKQAHIEGQLDDERRAFADHEAFPSEVEGKTVTDVHAQQAVDTEAVNQLAQEMIDASQEGEARGAAAGGLRGTGAADEEDLSGRHGRAEAILAGDEEPAPEQKPKAEKSKADKKE